MPNPHHHSLKECLWKLILLAESSYSPTNQLFQGCHIILGRAIHLGWHQLAAKWNE